MTPNGTHKGDLPHMRRWACGPIVSATVAAAVCAGAGFSEAAPLDRGGVRVFDASSTQRYWSLTNSTKESIWGAIERQLGSTHSSVGWEQTAPAEPNSWSQTLVPDTWWDKLTSRILWWGRICYRGSWWNMGAPTSYDSLENNRLDVVPDGRGVAIETPDGRGGMERIALTETPGDSGCGS